ncbi:VTT domain-containing protein [Actinotalea sp.]|uniref:DedA family protein n=1 Tax=Actinotalea sp. TaxID=1872145 RepID=UPI002B6FC474|nr:VTT domain-containing protein [Actinotalea sp.]HQY33742.1 VTT domain-containing protein [Actinotalea sp.]HRA51248.1 VTT domain-containing protein [Actinotalea sp.]
MVEEWVVALAGSPWVFVALYVFATIDGFFPPIPSESVIIALASLAVSTGEPNFYVLGAVAAAGAFTGDQIAYSIGRRLTVRDLRIMRGARQQRALGWAERALAERGAAFIIAARYIPVGRVAVNMTAGAVRFHRPRFTLLAVIAAITWSIYSVMLGIGAGIWLGEHPLLAVGVGVAGGLLLGMIIDPVLSWVAERRFGGRDTAAAPAAPSLPENPVDPAASPSTPA